MNEGCLRQLCHATNKAYIWAKLNFKECLKTNIQTVTKAWLHASYKKIFTQNLKRNKKINLSKLRFEHQSLGWMTDALGNSAMPPIKLISELKLNFKECFKTNLQTFPKAWLYASNKKILPQSLWHFTSKYVKIIPSWTTHSCFNHLISVFVMSWKHREKRKINKYTMGSQKQQK
jgi:hypothetical protein